MKMMENFGTGENFLLPRIPFLIDSVVNPTVAQLRKGDEIVAIDNVSGLDFAGYGQYSGAVIIFSRGVMNARTGVSGAMRLTR